MKKTAKKILVVDDSPVTQRIVRGILEKDNYKTIEAWDGTECLDILKKEHPDAIIMDIILPDINGKDVVKKIKTIPEISEIPIIFITNTIDLKKDKGYVTIQVSGQRYRAFAKPLHARKILSVLRKEINRKLYGGEASPKLEKS